MSHTFTQVHQIELGLHYKITFKNGVTCFVKCDHLSQSGEFIMVGTQNKFGKRERIQLSMVNGCFSKTNNIIPVDFVTVEKMSKFS